MENEQIINLDHHAGRVFEENKKAAPLIEWDEPIKFGDSFDLPVFNVDIFPNWLKSYVEGVAETTQTPIDAPSMACISLLSTILSRKFEVNVTSDWKESLNTFMVLALDSANRKSAVMNSFTKHIVDYERLEKELSIPKIGRQEAWLRAKKILLEKLEQKYGRNPNQEIMNEIYKVKEEIEKEVIITEPKLLATDSTPEKLADLMNENNEKISILSAEGGELFSMMKGRYSKQSNIDIYLKSHSSDYVSIERMGRDSIVLYNPTLTMGLFVQPSVIRGLPNEFQERGLTQRFFYSLPKSLVGDRKISPNPIPETVKKKYEKYIIKLLMIDNQKPVSLYFGKEAQKYEIDIRTEIEKWLSNKDLPDGFRGWLGKLCGGIIRLAGLIHVAEHITLENSEIPMEISIETLKKANSVKDYLVAHSIRAHDIIQENSEMAKANGLISIIRNIKEKKGSFIAYRDIQESTRRMFTKSKDLRAALKELEERQFIQGEFKGKKLHYHVNPKI